MERTDEYPELVEDAPEAPKGYNRVARDRQILCRYLEGQAKSEIAATYDIGVAQVNLVLRKPEVKTEIERLSALVSADIKERMGTLGEEAVDTVRDVMRGKISSELRFKAAKDLLDRNPGLKDKGPAGELAEGIGEAIIFQLAKMASQKAEQAKEGSDATIGDSGDTSHRASSL